MINELQNLLNELKALNAQNSEIINKMSNLSKKTETHDFGGVLGSTECVTELFGISGREEMTALEMLNSNETSYKSEDELEEERLVAKCDNAGIDDYHSNRDNN